MSARAETAPETTALYERLFRRFYADGNVHHDESASSHWREFAEKFTVRKTAGSNFELVGYGFGGSGNTSFFARLSALVGNMLHLATLRLPNLQEDVRGAKVVVKRMGLVFSQDAFRQVCTLNLLDRHLGRQAQNRILVIGDGHGILSALLHARYPSAQIYLADLGSVLFFQAYHLYKAYPEASQALTDENSGGAAVFNFCPADRLETLPTGSFDLAINIASMQEMDPVVTANYFSLLRQHRTRLFYCCNRLEKRLVGGETARLMGYPWLPFDVHIVDELCPWHQWWIGLGASPDVTVLGIPIPFMHRYDGPHWHRLTKLGKQADS